MKKSFMLMLLAGLVCSLVAASLSADEAVSTCLQIAAQKIKQGQRIVVTETGGMATRGGLVSVDTAEGTLTVRELGNARTKNSKITFAESQIIKIETERRWKPLYFLGGAFLGGAVGVLIADSIEGDNDDFGFDSVGEQIAALEISLVTGAAIGLILSITQGDKTVIECGR